QARCSPLAVVKNVRGFVQNEVFDSSTIDEVLSRHVACGFLAQSEERLRTLTQESGIHRGQVQVRQIPCRVKPSLAEKDGLDVVAREKDDRLLEQPQYRIPLSLGEEAMNHRRQLAPGPCREIHLRNDGVHSTPRTALHLGDECAKQIVVPVPGALQEAL